MFTLKFEGSTRRIISGIATLVFQIFHYLSSHGICIHGLFRKICNPEYRKDDTQLTTNVIMRFHEKYEIQNIDRNDILHSSFWRIGEELDMT